MAGKHCQVDILSSDIQDLSRLNSPDTPQTGPTGQPTPPAIISPTPTKTPRDKYVLRVRVRNDHPVFFAFPRGLMLLLFAQCPRICMQERP